MPVPSLPLAARCVHASCQQERPRLAFGTRLPSVHHRLQQPIGDRDALQASSVLPFDAQRELDPSFVPFPPSQDRSLTSVSLFLSSPAPTPIVFSSSRSPRGPHRFQGVLSRQGLAGSFDLRLNSLSTLRLPFDSSSFLHLTVPRKTFGSVL